MLCAPALCATRRSLALARLMSFLADSITGVAVALHGEKCWSCFET